MHDAEDLFQTGRSLAQQGRGAEAAECFRRAIGLAPGHWPAMVALASLCQTHGNLPAALALYQQAATQQPADAEIHFELGNVLQLLARLDDAVAAYRRAISLKPEYAAALCNLGYALRRQGDLQAALDCLRQSLQLQPNLAPAHNNLGTVLQDQLRLSEAEECFARACQLSPRQAECHYNLGTVLFDQARAPEAIASYNRALELQPNNRRALAARGMARLSLGDFAGGWADYEFRAGCPEFDTCSFTQPLWDGSPLGERILLIHCEQGFGDTLQFIRYVKLARQRCGQVIVAAPAPLLPLLAASGIPVLTARESPLPRFDVHAPLLSLPRILGTRLESVPAEVPYLATEPARVAHWQARLADLPGFRVGIAWQGRPTHRGDRLRSIPLEHFSPLAQVPGVRIVSLQKGPGREQLAKPGQFDALDLADALDEGGAFLDTAAVMQNLDLVITSDTAIAHLAGALGIRVWVALSYSPDWRWLRQRDASPWYPTMRLFRQTRLGHWPDVFDCMAAELSRFSRGV